MSDNNEMWLKMREVTEKRNSSEPSLLKLQREQESKKRLLAIAEKKLKTSFIHPLSCFEQIFGHLWGFGKKESELTEEQKKNRFLWNSLRSSVLNNGNGQIRAIHNELNQYTVNWNMYKYTLKTMENNDGNNKE